MEKNIKKLIASKGGGGVPIEDVNIRLLFNDKRTFKTHPKLIEHFKYPSTLSYQKKTFIAFQKVQGSEIILFYLEAHEYNDESLPANRRYVNIAYIDSLQYFSPENKELRRSIYYEIIQSYLNYAREMGFLKAYIWISPPDYLQEYVFNQHRIPYRPPSRESLKKFYQEMLEQAREKKIIHNFSSIEKRVRFFLN